MSGTTINVGPLIILAGVALFAGVSILVIVFRKKRAATLVVGGLILFAVLGAGVLVNVNSTRNAAQHAARLAALVEQQTAAVRTQQEVQFDSSSHSVSDEETSPLANAVTARSSQKQVTLSSSEEDTLVLNMDASRFPSAPNPQLAPIIPTTLPPVVVVSEVDTGSSCESETFPCMFSNSLGGYVFRGGAFGVLLILAYLFLDAGRRGRYTWPVRFGTAVLFTALCVLLWNSNRLM